MLSEVRAPALRIGAELSVELHRDPPGEMPGAVPLHRESIQADLSDLVEETFVRGVLAERLPAWFETDPCSIVVEPHWHARSSNDGAVESIGVRVEIGARSFELAFRSGRWMRRCQASAVRLQREGALGEGRAAYVRIVAQRAGDGRASLPYLPPLQAPEIADASLAELGIRAFEPGDLDPERPVLVNARMVAEILQLTEQAGANETGGATLGRIVRLAEPLPGTSTRVVTLLTASFTDSRRNIGLPGKFTFDPQALVDTVALAEQRELGESVLTCFHSHGWGSGCNRCNQNAACVLPEIDVSHEDYALLAHLFPGKATLLPIAGRRLGAAGERPVLEIHAWRGGRMGPIAWRAYQD